MRKKSVNIFTTHRSPLTVLYFSLFTLYFLLVTACTPDPPPTLNYKDRELVDSLFRMQIDSLKPLLDSLCEMRHDSAVQFKVDSMIEERQSEIDKYLNRIKNQQQ